MAARKDSYGDHAATVVPADADWEDEGKASWNIDVCCNGHYRVTSACTIAPRTGGALFRGTIKDRYGDHPAWVSPNAEVEDNEGKSPWVFTKM